MAAKDDEEERLRAVAMQNARSIVQARQRAEEALRKQSDWLRVTLASLQTCRRHNKLGEEVRVYPLWVGPFAKWSLHYLPRPPAHEPAVPAVFIGLPILRESPGPVLLDQRTARPAVISDGTEDLCPALQNPCRGDHRHDRDPCWAQPAAVEHGKRGERCGKPTYQGGLVVRRERRKPEHDVAPPARLLGELLRRPHVGSRRAVDPDWLSHRYCRLPC
jgi:hypothetical protein